MAPKLLQLRDPSGLAPGTVTLPPLGAAVLQLCDGEMTRGEILVEFRRRYGQAISPATLDAMLTRLDEAYMLDSERFRAYAEEVYRDYARAEVRPPIHAGRGYPAGEDALRAQLDGLYAPPNGPGLPPEGAHREADAPACPRAIIVPHTDLSRGGPAYAWAYRPLLRARQLPPLVVLLGTDHASLDPTITLTHKHLGTPLGDLETDRELVDELVEGAKAISPELAGRLFEREHNHRGEHSLELQAVWLRHALRRRGEAAAPRVLPILCGPLTAYVDGSPGTGEADPMEGDPKDATFGPFLKVLRDRLAQRQAAGQDVLWICSAELAHVGPRYGDKEPLSGADHDSLERRDRDTLRAVCAGDADAWLQEIRRERDRRRVSGLGPIYALLKAASPPLTGGQLRCYAQVHAEAGSALSIATVVF